MNVLKEEEELALGLVDVDAVTGDYVEKEMIRHRNAKSVFSSLFKKVKIPSGFKEIKVPRVPSASIVVNYPVAEGDALSESSYSYECNTVQTVKMGVYVSVHREALEQSARAVVDELIDEASTSIAREQDLHAFTVALDVRLGTITVWSGGTLGSTTLTPILDIKSLSDGTIQSVDYFDGKVLLAGSVSASTLVFSYSARCSTLGTGFVKDSTVKGSLTLDDILDLRNTMVGNTVFPDALFVHYIDMRNLAKDTTFQSLFTPSTGDRLNGELGEVLGLRVVSHGILPEGHAVLVQSDRVGYNVVKRDLWSTVQDKLDYDEKRIRVWIENEYAPMDTLAVGLVTNAKVGLYPASDL